MKKYDMSSIGAIALRYIQELETNRPSLQAVIFLGY